MKHAPTRRMPAAGAPLWRRSCALAAALLALVVLAGLGSGCGGAAPDANEPNDNLPAATILSPDTPTDGAIGEDDTDVFLCDAPQGNGEHAFVVTVRSAAPEDLQLQVGAAIPGIWEGITWPGWQPVVHDDRLELSGSLRAGRVLLFLRGEPGTEYSVDVAWQ